jgi:threonine synthase
MDTVADFACLACGTAVDATPAAGRCPECEGPLRGRYEFDDVSRSTFDEERYDGIARYAPLLPFDAGTLVTMAEGTTPLVPAPSLADELGVASVLVKDEGRNPTGTVRDRAFALAVTAAREADASEVALPTTGDGGQSAAAYAARAGLGSEAFVPTRSTFVAKAMTNVHGGEMSVVEGRYPDAVATFGDAMADTADQETPHSVAPGATPFRHEGLKTLTFELVEALDWTAPDAVVFPTAHGESVVGALRALEDLSDAGLAGGLPALHVAQPEGCAPIADAWERGDDAPTPVEHPDTLVGALEVPDPALGGPALDAVRETGGRTVAPDDDAALEAAVSLAGEGIEASATGGVGAAAARELAADGAFDEDDTVVLVNPVAGNKENDVLRSHLMRKGV